MSRHAGLTHHDIYQQQQQQMLEQQQQQAASFSSGELSAESFMEQKMENDSDGEERDLEAVRERSKVNNSNSGLPVPNEINKDEPEDVKPDIDSLPSSNTDATNTERSENHASSPSDTTTSSNSYHNTFPVPGQQQLYNQQQQSYNNSYGSLNTQFYSSMQMQQQLMLQQQQLIQQQNLQQSTSQTNFFGSESQPDATSYPQSQAQETPPQREYKVTS